ncbi:transposase [Micromonospora rubida]
MRNGTRPKAVLTDTGRPVRIDVPQRGRAGMFEPQIARKRQRRLVRSDSHPTRRPTPFASADGCISN